MPKYKEININVKVSPEAILGGLLGGTASIRAEQVAQAEPETGKAAEQKPAE